MSEISIYALEISIFIKNLPFIIFQVKMQINLFKKIKEYIYLYYRLSFPTYTNCQKVAFSMVEDF